MTESGTTASETNVAAPSSPAAGEGACPPPLEWQEVLREFHGTAHAWYLERSNYRLSGRMLGNGPPLYLLNGFSGTHELFALVVWLLRDQFRCVVFDYCLPPAGSRATLAELADDLLAVADTCGDRQIDVFAPSFGGLVALSAMHRHRHRIGRAILQGGFAHRRLTVFERLLIRACRFHPGRVRHLPLRALIQQQNHRRWFPPFDRTRWQFFDENTGHEPLVALAGRAALVRDADLRPVLGEVKQPVLLVRTEGEGQILEDCCRVLAEGLPAARVEWMGATGLYPYLTHPHRLAKVIQGFCPS